MTVLFGGADAAAPRELDEIWEYDGIDWVPRAAIARPTARRGHAQSFDPIRGRVVVTGGLGNGIDPQLVWEWDGVRWTSARSVVHPRLGFFLQQVYDQARGRTVLVQAIVFEVTTFEWDGQAWRIATDPPHPGGRDLHALAYDPDRAAIVLFGGYASSVQPAQDDTWERRGGAWHLLHPVLSPPGRSGHAMAFDPVSRATLLFGGWVPTGANDTWLWTGSGWLHASPPTSPPPRGAHAMACDTGRGRVVLFGGDGGSGVWRSDTWEWDGATWSQRFPNTVPPARANHAMAYDSRRGRTVMFGGGDYARPPSLGDHWEWDGNDWTQVFVPTMPPRRAGHAMVYDEDRGVVVMTGGYDTIIPYFRGVRNDTWEWDGANWTQRLTTVVPRPRKNPRAAYDRELRRTVLFGGDSYADTWTYGAVRQTTVESFGRACPGSQGEMGLTAVGTPSLGNRHFALRVSSARGGVTAAAALSATRVQLPLPGHCILYVQDPLIYPRPTDSRGVADLPLPIPTVPALVGADLFVQGIALDPGGPIVGAAVLSAGLRLRVD